MALGAERSQVATLVIREAMGVVGIGAVGGLLLAVAATRVLSAWLYGISATDPVTFLAVPLGFAVVAALACWIPARRATRVDPVVALRAE
jgi:ABC-type antimicrobial peptide transport system permease subunit